MPGHLPEESAGDSLHRLARAGLSMIPGLGGPAIEYLREERGQEPFVVA